jgi:STE24 endopeptidase
MDYENGVTFAAVIILGLIFLKWAAQLWLNRLNQRQVLAHRNAVPAAFRGVMDDATYAKSVQYTLARSRLSRFEDTYQAAILLLVLFGGGLPRAFGAFRDGAGSSAWAMALFLFATGLVVTLPSLPVQWFEQFRLEERFGFNTTTQRTWWLDRVKGLLLSLLLGYPLLVLVLKIVEWSRSWWWWAWCALMAFELVLAVLAPVLILPLFNKLTPLPEGSLRNRLLDLAHRTRFRAKSIQVMDGSKRSRHSNAFFAGFGRFRKIVLFDTLVQQLSETELESVLAHEIGHFKKKHIPKMLVFSAAGALAGLYAIAALARQEWFYRAFGFEPGGMAPAFLLFGLLSGVVTFWLSPLAHGWSRRYEYQADAFAAGVMGEAESLIGALRKLNEKNLSNLTPHPLYSWFYYSHPTLLERERALEKLALSPR